MEKQVKPQWEHHHRFDQKMEMETLWDRDELKTWEELWRHPWDTLSYEHMKNITSEVFM